MKRTIRISTILLLVLLLVTPAFAITEAEVQAQINATSREAVTGNVLIWFLCAIAFLKVSQKIDSFLASLGVNVGHTGGSMLAEVMLATRGVATIAGTAGRAFGGGRGASGGAPAPSGAFGGFLKGGLAGVVSRKVTNDAVKTATSATSAVNAVRSTASATASQTSASHQTDTQTGAHHSAQSESQTIHDASAQTSRHASAQTNASTSHTSSSATHSDKGASTPAFKGAGLGGAIFARSLMSGGSFANDVIGTVAKGDIRSTGSITGDLAAQSLQSYLGYAGDGAEGKAPPTFSNVEIGGGRITGIETAPGSSEGLAFGMYHAGQYTAPQGDYTEVHSADGTLWYKQYAQDAVERKPYMAPDDTVAYQESIVKRLPDPPKRKDRI